MGILTAYFQAIVRTHEDTYSDTLMNGANVFQASLGEVLAHGLQNILYPLALTVVQDRQLGRTNIEETTTQDIIALTQTAFKHNYQDLIMTFQQAGYGSRISAACLVKAMQAFAYSLEEIRLQGGVDESYESYDAYLAEPALIAIALHLDPHLEVHLNPNRNMAEENIIDITSLPQEVIEQH